jgi:hypothetical protein
MARGAATCSLSLSLASKYLGRDQRQCKRKPTKPPRRLEVKELDRRVFPSPSYNYAVITQAGQAGIPVVSRQYFAR